MIAARPYAPLAVTLLTAVLLCGVYGDASPLERHAGLIVFPSGIASLEKLRALPGYRLTVTAAGHHGPLQLYVPYAVYRLDAADVNNDGSTDILLGVIKRTHFDPELKRRLFFYRIGANGLTPLWLGSRVCQDLVDFRPVCDGQATHVLTIEKDKQGMYCNGLYVWHDFGLELITYSNNGASYDTALAFFDREGDPRRM